MIRWHRRTETCVMQDERASCQQIDSTFLYAAMLPVGYYSCEHTRTYECAGSCEITSENDLSRAQLFGVPRPQNLGHAWVRIHPKPSLPLFHRGDELLADSTLTAVYQGVLTGACNATTGALVAAAGATLWGARPWILSAAALGGVLTALVTGLAQSCSVARNIALRSFMNECNTALLTTQRTGLGDDCADAFVLLRIKAQDDPDRWRLLNHMIEICCQHYGVSARELLNGPDAAGEKLPSDRVGQTYSARHFGRASSSSR